MMTKETDTITNEGEESKYASILISTPGIRSPTVEKPVHYGQIDLDATKVNQFTYTYICTCMYMWIHIVSSCL